MLMQFFIFQALGFAYAKVMLAGNSNIQKYREFITKLLNTFVQYLNFYNVFPISMFYSVLTT